MKKNVLIATGKPFASEARDLMAREMRQAGLNVELLEGYAAASDLAEALKGKHGLIVRSDPVTADLMRSAGELEIVIRAGAGYDNIDVEYAKQTGIIVENTPGQNANAVAELAILLMLASVRPLDGNPGSELRGKILGVHGFGNIGVIVARLGRAFGMHVRAFDMNIDVRRAREQGVAISESAEALYDGADFVSLHIPENRATLGSVGGALLERMSAEGVLVNTARAGIVHESDLLRVLRERKGFRYAADVAPGAETAAAMSRDFAGRVIITPRKQGAQTREANLNACLAAARQMIAFFNEGDATFCVYKLVPPHLEAYTRLAVQLGKLGGAFIKAPRKVNVTGYGELQEFAGVIIEYVLKGLFRDVLGEECTPNAASAYAADRGIEAVTQEPDNTKGYGNALTVECVASDGASHSSRGRIDEGQMEASRIGEFKARMPLDPGLYVIATYKEGPGMADRAGHLLTDGGYNRVRLGAGPNMENTRAQAFFQVEKRGMSFENQHAEVNTIAEAMRVIPDVYEVKVISLA